MPNLKFKVGGVWNQIVTIKGDKGDPGNALPAGGVAGQLLIKNSATDNDATWQNNPSAPLSHGHSIGDVTNLQTALDGKSSTAHLHDDRYYTEEEVDAQMASKAPQSTTYTKTEVDSQVALLAPKGSPTFTGGVRLGSTNVEVTNGGSGNSLILSGTDDVYIRPQLTAVNQTWFKADGTIIAPSSISTNGIKFPATQVPSADPNTFDDYKEGTWIPVISGETVAGVGTYVNQTGNFTKIGNLIRFQIYISWSAHSGSGQLRISLPFTTASGIAETAISGYGASGTYPTTTNINFFVSSSVNYIRPDYRNSTNGAYVSGVLVDTSGYFSLSGTVQV